jgi:flagellar basal-body rod protein FlgC
MNIHTSGLTAERLRMDTISTNIANSETTRTEQGGPYIRKIAVFQEQLKFEMGKNGRREKVSAGIKAVAVMDSAEETPLLFKPDHPDADETGYVRMPNVNLMTEMIDMMVARRAYEANVTALNTSKAMLVKALEIGR